ncbi:16219_t:CDS:2, partial [Racocetra fulgida]
MNTILNSSLPTLIDEIVVVDTLPPNAVAQRRAANSINEANKKLAESQRTYNTTTDLEYTRKSAEKKAKFLQEQQIVERYNSP